MTDQHEPGSPPGRGDFTAIRRPRQDRMIAGVSTGVARWLNIDPVIVRVGFVVLAFLGLAGFILYAAGWLLLPEEGKDRSVVGETFALGNDEQIRMIGIVAAGILAVLAVIGDGGWGVPGWGWAGIWVAVWVGLPVAFVVWLVRRRQEPRGDEGIGEGQRVPYPGPPVPPPGTPASADAAGSDPTGTTLVTPPPAPRRPWSPALFLGTISVTLLAWGAMWLWSLDNEAVPAAGYAVVGLVITAVGLLIGSKFGDGGLLVPVGLVLVAVLAVSAALPSARSGDFRFTPKNVAQATRTLETGAGQVTYDLRQLDDVDALADRRVRISHGAGVVRVVVPRELDVEVDARVRWGGQVEVFDRRSEGWDARVHAAADGDDPFRIDITSTLGVIEVIRS